MTWDRDAIRAGALVALLFAVPFSLVGRLIADRDGDSTLLVWLNLAAVLGFVLGAGCAAWVQRVDAPLSHGLVTAVGTYVVAQAVFVLVRLIVDAEVRWFAVLFNLTITLGAGLVGGLLGGMLRSRGVLPSTMREGP